MTSLASSYMTTLPLTCWRVPILLARPVVVTPMTSRRLKDSSDRFRCVHLDQLLAESVGMFRQLEKLVRCVLVNLFGPKFDQSMSIAQRNRMDTPCRLD